MKDKIVVMHIAQANGGVAEYLKSFLKYSDNSKFEHILLVSNDYKDEEQFFIDKVKKIYYVDMVREISPIDDFKSITKIRKIIKEVNPDIIYSHSSKAGALVRVANITNRKKAIYNAHGWAFDMNVSNKKRRVYILIEKFLAKITDKIVCISDNDFEKAISERICKKNKLEQIINGIDFQEFLADKDLSEVKNKYNIQDNKRIIGMVARISEQKSPKTFITVAKKILESRQDVQFLLVGDGDQKEEVKEMIKSFGIEDSVIITGWVKDTASLIKIFDIGMLTSNWEGFGLVIPEYFISKVPTIASSVGGIKNIIRDGENGVLVSNQNIDTYVNAINQILDNDEFKKRISDQAFKDAINYYDVKRVVKEHEELFIKLIK